MLRVGDRVRFDGQVHVVAGLAGTTVRLEDEAGGASLVLFSHLLAADGFELLDCLPMAPGLPSFGLLDTVPEPALRKAGLLERHLVEAETGVSPDAGPNAEVRPEYDPKWRTLNERLAAKAEELAAPGTPVTERTLFRLRGCWREQGLRGLVDHRAIRGSKPAGHADQRLVDAVREALAGQEKLSTGTRSRVLRDRGTARWRSCLRRAMVGTGRFGRRRGGTGVDRLRRQRAVGL